MYDSNNINMNESNIYPSENKPKGIILSNPVVDDVSILSKQSETSMRITPDKWVFSKIWFPNVESW